MPGTPAYTSARRAPPLHCMSCVLDVVALFVSFLTQSHRRFTRLGVLTETGLLPPRRVTHLL